MRKNPVRGLILCWSFPVEATPDPLVRRQVTISRYLKPWRGTRGSTQMNCHPIVEEPAAGAAE